MDVVGGAVLGLWYTTVAARFVAVVVLVCRRFAIRYPLLVLYLGFGTARSGILLYAQASTGYSGYRSAWLATQTAMIVFSLGATAESYWTQARRCRKFLSFGIALACLFSGIAAATAVCTMRFPDPPLIVVTRYYATGALVFLLLSRAFFAYFEVPVSPNAEWNAWILALLFAGESAGIALAGMGSRWMGALCQFATIGSALCSYLLWASKMTRKGETAPEPPLPSREEIERADEQHRREKDAINRKLQVLWRSWWKH